MAPSRAKLPRYDGARHLMMSSSMPPAEVTIAETWLCWTRYRMTSRRPEEIRFDVYPRKIVALDPVSGSRYDLCLMYQ